MFTEQGRYFVVHEGILPEALIKTVYAKELLAHGKVKTINEAVQTAELSRSAFYKYKDGIYAFDQLETEQMVAISLNLQHRSGVLSKVLSSVASLEGNVITIHQAIPLQGVANVVLTVNISAMKCSLDQLLHVLKQLDGVELAELIGHG